MNFQKIKKIGVLFHQKYEKVLKTTQNVPKTMDNHQEQLVLGLGYQF